MTLNGWQRAREVCQPRNDERYGESSFLLLSNAQFLTTSEKWIQPNWGKYAHKKPFTSLFSSYIGADKRPWWQLCVFSSRWKYGSRTSAPSIKRSWSMAMDQRGSISTAPTPSPPARPGCPSFGRFPWRTKEATCIQTITWTLLDTGIQTTSLTRTRCPGLRWCEWVVFDVAQTSCSGFDWTCSQS